MPVRPNTFTLSGQAVEERIENQASSVRLGGSLSFIRIPFGTGPMSTFPVFTDEHVIRANMVRVDRQPRLVRAHDQWNGILLRVIAYNLKFPFKPLARRLNLNAGAEGQEAFAYFGRPNEPEFRDQLFVLGPSQSVFVIDGNGAVGVVTCIDGQAVMRPAAKEEVVRYVERLALGTRHIPTIDWARRQLTKLEVPHCKAVEDHRTAVAGK